MNQPAPLRRGDKVAIVAPARKVSPKEMQPAINMFEHWGLHTVVPQGLYEEFHQFAGTDNHRAQILQQVIDDDEIRAVFCARGGYGTARIIDQIDFSKLATHPKWIIGYSDATILHNCIYAHDLCPTVHAIMPINITADTSDSPATRTLHDLLFSTKPLDYTFRNTDSLNRQGSATAPIVGGNLSILYSLLGTPYDIDTRGKILMIEDLDEYLYHIDRMMLALRHSGKLQGLKGLIIGQFTDLHDNSTPFGMSLYDIVSNATKGYDFPICFNAPFGHIEQDNLALPLGTTATLTVFPDSAHLSL